MDLELRKLQQHVQHNCHISDATHAGNYTLCIYLLKMREYYRWEHAMGFDDRIENDNIGKWLTDRESLWETLEESQFRKLSIGDKEFEPFDIDAINNALQPENLVYSAGYILRGKPHFFLADIDQVHEHDEYRIIVSGREYARELSAPPALSQGGTIFIRSESLRRTVWEKVEESLWNTQQSPLVRAISCYDFKNNLQQSLALMCDRDIDTLVAHEIGEITAGKQLGESWQEMISAADHPPLELMLRSIRDNLADCIMTIPDIIENLEPARLHFYIANIGNMRKALFPALREAYDCWLEDNSTAHLQQVADKGKDHWLSVAKTLQDMFQKEGKIKKQAFQEFIESQAY
ncbi:MAG: Sfum_1244 family protein [Arenicellales bacterium]